MIWGWGRCCRDTVCSSATHFRPFLGPLDTEIGESPEDWYIHDATVTACPVSFVAIGNMAELAA